MKKKAIITTIIIVIIFICLIICNFFKTNNSKADTSKFQSFFSEISTTNLNINNFNNNKVPSGFYSWLFDNLNNTKFNMRSAFNIDKLLKYNLENKQKNNEISELLTIQYALSFAKILSYKDIPNIPKLSFEESFGLYNKLLSELIYAVDKDDSVIINTDKILSFLNDKKRKDQIQFDEFQIYNFLQFIEIANKLLIYEIKYKKLPKSLFELGFSNLEKSDITYKEYVLKWHKLELDFEKNNSKMRKLGKTKYAPIPQGFELKNANSLDLKKALNEYKNAEKIYIENSDIDFNQIQLPNSLRSLMIVNSKVLGLNEFKNLTKLKDLTLRNCQLDYSEINQISNLKNLTYLEISDTVFDSIKAIKDLKELKYLLAKNTNISDLSGIENLKKLTFLNLDNTKITDIANLSKNINLEELSLENTRISDIRPLRKLNKLSRLYIGGTEVPKSEIENLRKTKNLYISDIDISKVPEVNTQMNIFYNTEI